MSGMRLPPYHLITAATSFYFLRHGESEGNRGGIVQGRTDFDLSEKGETHARSAGEWLKTRGIQAVFSSPLRRSFRTAEIAAAAGGMPSPRAETMLTELETGVFTNRSFVSIEETDPLLYRRFRERSWEGVEGAETVSQLSARSHGLWNMLVETAEKGKRSILCVTHSGILQWILKTSMGAAESWMPLFQISNCGIFQLFVSPPHADGTVPKEKPESFYAQWKLLNHIPYER